LFHFPIKNKYHKGEQINEDGWAGSIARVGEIRITYKILVEKSEGMRPLWRTSPESEDNIKMKFM